MKKPTRSNHRLLTARSIKGIHFLLDNRKSSHIMARVPQSKTPDSPYKVQVLDRALAALAILANSLERLQPRGAVPCDEAPQEHVHRLMMVLEQHRLVVKNPETGRYRFGAEAL